MHVLPSTTFPVARSVSLGMDSALKAPSMAVRYSHSKAIDDLSRDVPMLPGISISLSVEDMKHDSIDENFSMSPSSKTAVSDFWRYFQDETSLQFVITGGNPDAIISLLEAKVLLSNLRGCLSHRIPDDDAGVKHLRGRSVRELRHFLVGLDFDAKLGASVVRDLACGGAVGSARLSLIRAQKDKIDSHLRKQSDHFSPRSTMTLTIPVSSAGHCGSSSIYGSELVPPLLCSQLSSTSVTSAVSRMSGVSAATDSLSLSWPPTPSVPIPHQSSMESLSAVSGEIDVEEITVYTTSLMSEAWMHALKETDESPLLLTGKRCFGEGITRKSLDAWMLHSATHEPSTDFLDESIVVSEDEVVSTASMCVERLAALMHAPVGV